MVEDSEIKAVVSPFAIRQGEIKTFDGKDGYVSMNQIIQKINIGHIGEIHFRLMELVNEFEFITTRQLFQLIEGTKYELDSQDKLKNKLDQLVKSKILTRYYFSSENGKGIYRIFCLEKMGKYLLNSRNVECKWQPTDNTKPVSMIKKRLAGNQTMIAYMNKVEAYKDYVVKPVLVAKSLGKQFKASGGEVILSKEGRTINFLFEVVRREEDWGKKLTEKMKLYNDFYTNFVPGDSGFAQMPQIILICEDDNHLTETFKTIVMNRLENSRINYYYTTDLRQNEESLEKSLISFKLDPTTNKYKMINDEIKLLS